MTPPHYIDRLIGFAVHDDDCTVNRFPGHDACSCGLSALLQEARHARRDTPMEAVAWRWRWDNHPSWNYGTVTPRFRSAPDDLQALAVIPTQGGGE